MYKINACRRRLLSVGATTAGLSLLPFSVLVAELEKYTAHPPSVVKDYTKYVVDFELDDNKVFVEADTTVLDNAVLELDNNKIRNAKGAKTLHIKKARSQKAETITFFDGKSYIGSALRKLNTLFSDNRTKDVIHIDLSLFDLLFDVQQSLSPNEAIHVLSGYRSAASNKKLGTQISGVADDSYHVKGQAVDFYIPGVPLRKILQTALELRKGGVGYYPNSHFIHVDTGPTRYWPRATVARAMSGVKKSRV